MTANHKGVVTNVFTQNTEYSYCLIRNITAFLESIKESQTQGHFYEKAKAAFWKARTKLQLC